MERSSSVKGGCQSKIVFHQRSSSVKGRLQSKVVFRLPSKLVFRQRSSSIGGRLPSSCPWCVTPDETPLIRHANNGVSRYPSYQKIFGLTENFEWNYRTFVAKMIFLKKLPLFWNENLFCQDTNFQKKVWHSTSYFIQFSLNIPIP